MIIHNGNNSDITVHEKDSSYLFKELKNKTTVTLSFSLSEYVDIKVGATIGFEKRTYTMYEIAKVTKISEREYEYTCTFADFSLEKYRFINTIDRRLDFVLTAKPHEFIQHIVDNLNERESGWSVGDYLVAAEKTISFSNNTILEVLNSIANNFETEWEIIDKRISLRKVEYFKDNPLALSYGRGNGFKSGITRQLSGETAIDVLYCTGGERNINQQTYTYQKNGQTFHAKQLRLPKGQTFYYLPPTETVLQDRVTINKGTVYSVSEYAELDSDTKAKCMEVETDVDGYGIHRKQADWVNNGYENCLSCTDVYPKKVLTVTAVTNSNPQNYFWEVYVSNNDIDYKQHLIAGQDPTMIFETGMLVGKEFTFNYKHDTKCFEILPIDSGGMKMPNTVASGYVPKVGDKFAVFHISLPTEYITAAEMEMLLEGCYYMYKHSEIEVEFNGTVDNIWAEKQWNNIYPYIRVGAYVRFTDNAFCQQGKDLRVLSVKQYLSKPHQPELILSNSSVSQGVTAEIQKIATNQVSARNDVVELQNLAARTFDDAKKTIGLLEQAIEMFGDYYSESISPIAVKTMQLLVGDTNLQFEFGTIQNNDVSTFAYANYEPTWDNTNKRLNCPNIYMRHHGYSNTKGAIVSSNFVAQYPYWYINTNPPYFDSLDSGKAYYLYIVAAKSALEHLNTVTTPASFALSEQPHSHTNDMFYFLVGILNAENNGTRSFASLFGFTEILGNRISTDIIKSNDGQTFIDLKNNIIQGVINFVSGLISGEIKIGSNAETAICGLGGEFLMWGKDGNQYKFYIEKNGNFRYIISKDCPNNNGFVLRIDTGSQNAVPFTLMRNLEIYPSYSTEDGSEFTALKVYGRSYFDNDIELSSTAKIKVPVFVSEYFKKRIKLSTMYTGDKVIYLAQSPVIMALIEISYSDGAFSAVTYGGAPREDYDNLLFSITECSRLGTGIVRITFSHSFPRIQDYYIVGIGTNPSYPCFVSIKEKRVNGFTAFIGDDNTPNDLPCEIKIMAIKGYDV